MTDTTHLTSQHGDGTELASQTPEHNEHAERSRPDIGNAGDLLSSEADADAPSGRQTISEQPNGAGATDTFEFGTRMLPDLTDAHVIEHIDADLLSNYVEVVGYVRPQRVRGRERVLRGHRDRDRNVGWYDMLLHVDEADRATAFGIRLDIRTGNPAVLDMLEALQDGERLWVCGQLVSSETYDTRFAEQHGPDGPTLGRPMQELSVRVMRLRRARPEDVNGSLVKLRGTLLQVPRITRHETETALQIARCILDVQSVLPSANPRTRAVVHVQSRIQLDIPLMLPGAVSVLRRGNGIEIDGSLEPYRQGIRFDRDAEAAAIVERMRQDFELRKQRMSEAEVRRAERGFNRHLLDMQTEPRIRVRAGYVGLVHGAPVEDLAEVRSNYVAWDRERRRINRERAVQRGTMQQGGTGVAQMQRAGASNGATRSQPVRYDDHDPEQIMAEVAPEQRNGQSAPVPAWSNGTEQVTQRVRHRRRTRRDGTSEEGMDASSEAAPVAE